MLNTNINQKLEFRSVSGLMCKLQLLVLIAIIANRQL